MEAMGFAMLAAGAIFFADQSPTNSSAAGPDTLVAKSNTVALAMVVGTVMATEDVDGRMREPELDPHQLVSIGSEIAVEAEARFEQLSPAEKQAWMRFLETPEGASLALKLPGIYAHLGQLAADRIRAVED